MNSHFIELTSKLYRETINQTINQLGNTSRDGKIELNEARIENLKNLWQTNLTKLFTNHEYRPDNLKKPVHPVKDKKDEKII